MRITETFITHVTCAHVCNMIRGN